MILFVLFPVLIPNLSAHLYHTKTGSTNRNLTPFEHFIDQLLLTPDSLKSALVDSFFNQLTQAPIVENDTTVHFVYRGSGNSVTIAGDANDWNPDTWPMLHVPPTNFWYYTTHFEADARLEYKFVKNGNNWLLDPLNPYTCLGGFGPNSELRMAQYVPPPEIKYNPAIPHGSLSDTTFYCSYLNQSRPISIYTPPDYVNSEELYGVVLLHDGPDYLALANARNVFDYLISQAKTPPLIAVFVPALKRTDEYAGALQADFSAFIVDTLMTWLDQRYRTLKSPQYRCVAGASNGGNIALWLGVTHPEIFGKIAAFSSNVEENIQSVLKADPKRDLKFYLDIGTYDLPVLIPRVNALKTILQEKGYTYKFQEIHEGHSWGNWKAHLDDALIYLFSEITGVKSGMRLDIPQDFELCQNFPNPFNPVTEIRFQIPQPTLVTLEVFNVMGEKISSLADQLMPAGRYTLKFDGTELASGVYFYHLNAGMFYDIKKCLLLK